MSAAPDDDVASRLRRVLVRLDGLPDRDRDSIRVLVEAGEWTVALENLCTQIFELDIETDEATDDELHGLGELLDVHTAYLLGDPWATRDDRGGT